MLRNLKIAIAISVAVFGSYLASAEVQAGWGHHHHGYGHGYGYGVGHHHHGFYGGGFYGGGGYGRSFYGGSWGGLGYGGLGYGGLGYSGYGWGSRYTSLSIGIGLPSYWGYTYDYPRRYPYIYPGSLSSFDYYYPTYPLSSYYSAPYYSAPYYSSSYAPNYSASYYTPYASSYSASSACCAPVMASACCDPCAGYPATSAPAAGPPSYQPDTAPAAPSNQADPSADAPPSVRSLPANWIPSAMLTRAGDARRAAGQGRESLAVAHTGARLTAAGRDSAQGVSLAKPVTLDIALNVIPLSKPLLEAADAIFAAGDYQQAAAAYARLTVRYGNHDELAVRRFIALVASGDCEQAAVMFETASLAEQTLGASALPTGGLAELYGSAAAERAKHVDYLAAYGLKHPEDGVALAMVGTWLELDGQTERAKLFRQQAAALAPSERLPTDSAHLVATDVPQ